MRLQKLSACCGSLLLAGLFAGHADGEVSPNDAGVRFFEQKIRPLLAERCYRCHGEKRQRGDLRLDSLAAMQRGGSSAQPVIVPGHPEKSLLIQAVLRRGDLKMPPTKPLSKQDVAYLIQWVNMGAPFPRAQAVESEELHWAFQPVRRPELPKVARGNWCRTPIDRFILARLEAKGLSPAPPADRRTLIRRLTFDLIGLPPSPEEVQAFVEDDSPDAYEKVVERLLASPHYGERWGRHWLDIARYADSNGLDENVAYGNAWRYRDYVVQAFNADLPYDRFLIEQIAGDLLPARSLDERRRQLIATGFLALGPKVLAEVDEKKMELDILDEQIDTLGRSILGLTLGCARCHNHKFDPITMEDYYALAGIFQSTKTMETFKKVARWHENVLADEKTKQRVAKLDQRIAGLEQEIKRLKAKVRQAPRGQENPSKDRKKTDPPAIRQRLSTLQSELERLKAQRPELPSAMGVTEGKVTDAHLLRRGNHLHPIRPVPRRLPVVLAGTKQPAFPKDSSGRLRLARWLASRDNPLTARVMVNRIWRWHFGRGIVKTTDNFGRLGAKPTHPKLLDWLAAEFVARKWSIKAMHRLIVLSSTYRMSSRYDAMAVKADASNTCYWRWEPRRLEAEAIRDAALFVAGTLDRKMGGSLLHVKNREYFFNHTSKDKTRYDSHRRSLYLPVVRNNLYDLFQLFDATDATVSNGNRPTTTVATQALFMMNSELMYEAAEHLARRISTQEGLSDSARIVELYNLAFGRAPTDKEASLAREAIGEFSRHPSLRGLDASARDLRVWTWLCHMLLASNEFVYLN